MAVIPAPQALPVLLKRGAPAGKGAPGAESRESSLLVVGDVDFDSPPGPGAGASAGQSAPQTIRKGKDRLWDRLPATRGEMLSVRDSFEEKYPFPDGQTRALRGSRATESNFRQQAPRHRWLHVATHGYYAPPQLHQPFANDSSAGQGRNIIPAC